MRQPRLKVPPETGPAIYHCISRVVGGERLLDDPAKEVLRRQMWELADFCGLDLLTYALLSNHFHLLALVPQKTELTDAELLRRFRARHPPVNRRQARFLQGLATLLEQNGPAAQQWRQKQRAMMGDLSQYMKLLKQGFTTWYNDRHERFGTLWAERFQSELVEAARAGVVAAYIDLNSVRAGLVQDPKDYRCCGYAEAVAGNQRAQRGLAGALGLGEWPEVQAAYRVRLFGTAAMPREGAASVSPQQLQEVMAAGGQLPCPRCCAAGSGI